MSGVITYFQCERWATDAELFHLQIYSENYWKTSDASPYFFEIFRNTWVLYIIEVRNYLNYGV